MQKPVCKVWFPDMFDSMRVVPREVAAFWLRKKWNGRDNVKRERVNGSKVYYVRRPSHPVVLVFIGVEG